MITRTITTTTATMKVVNVTEETIEEKIISIEKSFKSCNDIQDFIKKNKLLSPAYMLIKVVSFTESEERYGIDEKIFMQYATKLSK